MTDYTVGVLEDAIKILNTLRDHNTGLTLSEITDTSGFVKNKVFRLLYTLEKNQMVDRDSNGLYHMGIQMITYAQTVEHKNWLMVASHEVMDWLGDVTGETIFLGIVSGNEALCIATRESTQSIRLYAEVGRRAPLHSGGVPKALLANLPDTVRTEKLEAMRNNEDAPDMSQLADELYEIQQQGFVVVVDELDVGAHSVAAPIFNHNEHVVAALSIAGPSVRFTSEKIEEYRGLVLSATRQISQKLGHRAQEKVPS